jgi:CheY-like chemotaxis protein
MHTSHRVLIVDDEPLIRLVLRRTLEGEGYRVVEATNGLEALAMFANDRHGISAVFSDVSMPEMDGFELASKLRSLAPTVPVVLGSGGSAALSDLSSTERLHPAVVPKPYSRHAVLSAIAGALAAR